MSKDEQIVYVASEKFEVVANYNGEWPAVLTAEMGRGRSEVRAKAWIEDDALLTRAFVSGSFWSPSGGSKSEAFKKTREGIIKSLSEAKKDPPDTSILHRMSALSSSVRRMFSDLSSLEEYNIQPDIARQASDPLPMTMMGNDGSAVSEVISALESRNFKRLAGRYDQYFTEYYSAWLNFDYRMARVIEKNNPLEDILNNLSAGVASIERIGTEIDPSTGRRYVVFYSGDHRFRPDEVSDGTIKWLCLLVALYVPRSKVVLLEEPENFMHPWMQQRFIQLAREQAKRSESSVVLSTHSVTVLNAIEISELSIVKSTDGQTTIESVKDEGAVERMLRDSSFGLGDVWVSGAIGGVSGEA